MPRHFFEHVELNIQGNYSETTINDSPTELINSGPEGYHKCPDVSVTALWRRSGFQVAFALRR